MWSNRAICGSSVCRRGCGTGHPEGGIEYAAQLERRLDFTYQHAWRSKDDRLTMAPSEYFRRNVYLTSIEDVIGLNNLRFTGCDRFMWSSDNPHSTTTWPRSRELSTKEFDEVGVSESDRRKLTLTNVADLSGLDLETVSRPSAVISDRVSAASDPPGGP